MSRTDAHTPLWVRNLDPDFNEYRALQQGLRICACWMCYGTDNIRYHRSSVRTRERIMLRKMIKTSIAEIADEDDWVNNSSRWISHRQ